MRRLILAAVLFALPVPAFAEVVPPLVAKSPIVGYPATKCGWFGGINAIGAASGVTGAPAGTTMIAGDVGGTVGYACPIGGLPWFIEGLVDFQNLNAGAPGFSLSGPVHLEQRVGVQVPILQFFPAFGLNLPTPPNLPVLPPGVTVTGAMQTYLYGAVYEDDVSSKVGAASGRAWLVSGEGGTGVLVPARLGNGMPIVLDAWAGVAVQSTQMCIGVGAASMCPKLGTGVRTGVSVKF